MEIRCDLGAQNTVIFIISCAKIGMYIAYFFVQFMTKSRLCLSPAQRDFGFWYIRAITTPNMIYGCYMGLIWADM